MQVICIELICLYVQVFISSVNEHCDHYLTVIACLIKPWFFFLTPSLLDHFILASYAFHAFLHKMIKVYCCVSGDSCLYDSRALQFVELGMSELCSTVPNSHVKFRVYFRVLLRNSQKGRL